MTLTGREYHDAYEAFAETYGAKTDNVIAMLQPASDLVSKDDLAVTTAVLRSEMADLRTDLQTEMADLRTELKTEMADLRTELKTEMAGLRTELTTEMAGLRIDMTTQISDSLQQQTRMMIATLFGAVALLILTSTLQGILL